MAEVYEVASFYAHFDIVMEARRRRRRLTVRVCDSLTCAMMGAEALARATCRPRLEPGVRVVRAPCMGGCHNAPVAAIGHALHEHASVESVTEAVRNGDTHPHVPDLHRLRTYRAEGGYKLLAACLDGKPPGRRCHQDARGFEPARPRRRGLPDRAQVALRARRTRRRASWPSTPTRASPAPSRTGIYLETDPHRFLEGMLIGAWAVEAEAVYIYLRDEYPQCREILLREIAKLEAAGLARHTEIHLRRGAGAYICGEESAMLESIEGKRGLPRHKPPFPSQVGLFGRPTLINNVETALLGARHRRAGPGVVRGARAATAARACARFSVSGRVRRTRASSSRRPASPSAS